MPALLDPGLANEQAPDTYRVRLVTTKGDVVIDVSLVEEREAQVELQFSVRDTGIGIPDEDLPKIFEPFKQLDSGSARRYGGSGLGLSIVAQIAQLYDAGIQLDAGLNGRGL